MNSTGLTHLRQLVLAHLLRTKWSIALALLCLLGAILMELLAPWPLKLIFDYVLLGKTLPASLSALGPLFQWGMLPAVATLAGAVFLMVVVGGAFSYGQVYLVTKSGYELAAALRKELFSHIQRLSLAFHSRSRAGELLMKVSSDTTAIRDALADWGVRSTYQLLMMAGMLVIMCVINWRLSLVVLGSLPVLYLVLTHLNRKIKESVGKQRRQEGKIASRMSEVFGSIAMVQAFARHDFEDDRFAVENAENLAEGVSTARTTAVVTRMIELICAFSTATTIFVGSWQAFKGYMTPGDLLIFVSYLRTLYKPIRDLGKISVKMTRASVCANRIEEVLALQPDIRDKANPIIARSLRGDIVFKNVSFAYDARRQVLDDVSFHIQPGERVALVGPSGTGKSSLIGLILRLHDPQAGSILVDGLDVTHYERESLRREIGVVLQDTTLLQGSIRDNICYGRPGASLAEIEEAARQAHAHDFITAFPDGYDTQVGERGCTLSGGQRQRICLARALIKHPSILILDEPTSAIDPASADLIRDAIGRFQAGKSVLVISHQLSAADKFDQILTLRNGRICDRGSTKKRVHARSSLT
jgi:ATP-binding cassette subfamily B protein/subfamily B ATP-binding cassette protein MsbA